MSGFDGIDSDFERDWKKIDESEIYRVVDIMIRNIVFF